MRTRTTLGSIGNPMSDLNVQRRLRFLRESEISHDGIVFIPESWVKNDPALQTAVQELDWLQIEKPPE